MSSGTQIVRLRPKNKGEAAFPGKHLGGPRQKHLCAKRLLSLLKNERETRRQGDVTGRCQLVQTFPHRVTGKDAFSAGCNRGPKIREPVQVVLERGIGDAFSREGQKCSAKKIEKTVLHWGESPSKASGETGSLLPPHPD